MNRLLLSGRQRRVSTVAAAIVAVLRVPQLCHKPVVEKAMRTDTLVLLGVLNAACDSIGQLTAALSEAFRQHPDTQIHHQLSRPGRHQRRDRAR